MYRCLPFILALLSCLPASGRTVSYAAVTENGYWKIIDPHGHILVDSLCTPDEASLVAEGYNIGGLFAEGLFPCKRDGLWGFKNIRNEWAVPCIYPLVRGFRDGRARVWDKKQWGLIDEKGAVVLPAEYDGIYPSDSGMILLVRNGVLGAVDRDGKQLLPFVYGIPRLLNPGFSEGLLPVAAYGEGARMATSWFFRPGGKIGFIDRKGRLVIDTIYNFAWAVGNRVAEWRPCEGCCGSGMRESLKFAQANPYYLMGDYFRFEGGRCLVAEPGGLVKVIDTKGDSVFALPLLSRHPQNVGGYIIVQIEPKDANISLLQKMIRQQTADTQRTHGTKSAFEHGKFYLFRPDGTLLLKDCQYMYRRDNHIYYKDAVGKVSYFSPPGLPGLSVASVDASGWFRTLYTWGYKNEQGEVMIPPRFSDYTAFRSVETD